MRGCDSSPSQEGGATRRPNTPKVGGGGVDEGAPDWVLGKAIISLGAHIEQFGGPRPALVGRGRRYGGRGDELAISLALRIWITVSFRPVPINA